MQAEFWHNAWKNRSIGFHLPKVNPLLIKYLPALELQKGSRIFVPLCGKTLDLAYLISEGFEVVACELNEGAIQELFDELETKPKIEKLKAFTKYSIDKLEVYCGDFFELEEAMVGRVDAVYDRASIVALPLEMRKAYVSHLLSVTHNAPQLMISFEYDQNLRQGPPFSVLPSEVKEHYKHVFELKQLTQHALKGKHAQINAYESVWFLKPL